MIIYTQTPDYYNDYIQHFNPFHNPKNGQFASKNGGTVSRRQMKVEKRARKDVQKNNIWSKSDDAPLSLRSTVKVMKYALNGTEKNHKKALESTKKDKERWKAAQNYKKKNPNEVGKGISDKTKKKWAEREKRYEEAYKKQQEEFNKRKNKASNDARKLGYSEDFIKWANKTENFGGIHNIDDFEYAESQYNKDTGKKPRKRSK